MAALLDGNSVSGRVRPGSPLHVAAAKAAGPPWVHGLGCVPSFCPVLGTLLGTLLVTLLGTLLVTLLVTLLPAQCFLCSGSLLHYAGRDTEALGEVSSVQTPGWRQLRMPSNFGHRVYSHAGRLLMPA
jgi:hypothetical protein